MLERPLRDRAASRARRVGAATFLTVAIVAGGCRAVLGIDEDRPLLEGGDGAVTADGGRADGMTVEGGPLLDGSTDAAALDAGVVGADRRFALYPLPPADTTLTGYEILTETVKDLTTGLEWERGAGQVITRSYTATRDRCGGLTLAGASDWRVPTRIEVLTIIDFVRTPLQLDLNVFWSGAGEVGPVWTASVTAAGARYSLDWKTLRVTTTTDENELLASICVRGGPATSPVPRYEVGSGFAHDVSTGLFWEREPAGTLMTHADAAKRCADLALLDAQAWRLPDARELVSLIDETRPSAPLIDPLFGLSPSSFVWSSTPGPENVGALVVDFGNADVQAFPTAVTAPVRCVRK